jgi:hypothetical protein
MIYRNDVEALEARHRALETEVAERIRARDEVAHMLADARGRAQHEAAMIDHVVGRRRGRRRMWFACAMAVLIAIGCGIGYGLARSSGPDREQQMLDRYEGLVDDVCGCADEACAQKAMAEMAAWAQRVMEKGSPRKFDDKPADVERMKQLADRFTGCMMRLTHPGAGAAVGG